jgi:allantoin racemase
MKIWHQSATELGALGAYKLAIEAHAAQVTGGEAQVDVHGLPPGAYAGAAPSAVLANAYAYHRTLSCVIDYAIQAEREGYDAFVVGSFSEPFLREIRSAVDIPVASLAESSVLVGCSLGHSIAMISNAPSVQWMTKSAVEKHGLGARVLDVVSLDPPLDEHALSAAFADPAPLIASFRACASRLVARGADVIIPAEGVLAGVLVRNGIKEIEGAALIDVFGVTWHYAMMLARLWSKTGLRVGRAWHYRRDDPALVARLSERKS